MRNYVTHPCYPEHTTHHVQATVDGMPWPRNRVYTGYPTDSPEKVAHRADVAWAESARFMREYRAHNPEVWVETAHYPATNGQ